MIVAAAILHQVLDLVHKSIGAKNAFGNEVFERIGLSEKALLDKAGKAAAAFCGCVAKIRKEFCGVQRPVARFDACIGAIG